MQNSFNPNSIIAPNKQKSPHWLTKIWTFLYNRICNVVGTTDQQDLNTHIATTYLQLRRGMAIIAFAFPFVLVFGALLWGQVSLLGSISAYYHTPMRNIFVGVLCAVGTFLYLYKGYTDRENYALNVAGVCAIGVALFPTDPSELCGLKQELTLIAKLHGASAVTFFLAIAYACICLSHQTIGNHFSQEQKKRYRLRYTLLGSLMIGCVVLGIGAIFIPKGFEHILCKWRPIFFVETFAVLTFSAYWITKSTEIDREVSWLPSHIVSTITKLKTSKTGS